MVDKVLQLVGGKQTEVPGTVTSTGSAEAGKMVALGPDGRLDPTLMPPGLVDESDAIIAGEALSAGNYVYISSVDSKAYKADASNVGKGALGYVTASAAANASVRVYYEGVNTAVTGYTPGARYYLSTTPGVASTTVPSYAGGYAIHQFLGTAATSAKLIFEGDDVIVLAA